MKIEWFNHGDSLGAVTIYANNICLNKQASSYFIDAFAVAIGIDHESGNLVIKNISKEEAESPKTEKNNLNKIAIKSSYGRITGKKMIDQISGLLELDFSNQQAFKYNAKWNTGSKMLIVETNGGAINV